MSRLQGRFAALRDRGRRALIPFVTAGDPDPSVTVPLMHALVGAGADVIELGVPFSDPMADGPVIQRASERALAKGASLAAVLDMVSAFRRTDADTPVVLMGYLNPFECAGYEAFAESAATAGVDGILTVDLPPEEADGFHRALRSRDLDLIFLIAPNTGPERLRLICEKASGYVYYVSLKGVTGSAHLDVDSVRRKIEQIRGVTALPIAVGFGISDGATAARVAAVSDAVIVGSALVRRVEELSERVDQIPATLAAALAEMRTAMDAGPA